MSLWGNGRCRTRLWGDLLLLGALLVASVSGAAPAYVIHVVADDLGYHDTNWRNNQTITPNLDSLVAKGVEIPEVSAHSCCQI